MRVCTVESLPKRARGVVGQHSRIGGTTLPPHEPAVAPRQPLVRAAPGDRSGHLRELTRSAWAPCRFEEMFPRIAILILSISGGQTSSTVTVFMSLKLCKERDHDYVIVKIDIEGIEYLAHS